jgi:hypothetical protein
LLRRTRCKVFRTVPRSRWTDIGWQGVPKDVAVGMRSLFSCVVKRGSIRVRNKVYGSCGKVACRGRAMDSSIGSRRAEGRLENKRH